MRHAPSVQNTVPVRTGKQEQMSGQRVLASRSQACHLDNQRLPLRLMKLIQALCRWSLAVLASLMTGASLAQPFDSGSTGAYGPMAITTDTTLDVPPDGVFHCTTISISAGVTLRFKPNGLNTPVILLSRGDVTIQGTIDLSGGQAEGAVPGAAGPGGFDGGYGGFAGSPGGDGKGPGGGIQGQSRYNAAHAQALPESIGSTNTYGNALLMPIVGGSGGAGSQGSPGGGGGGGGGAVLIASNTRISVNGSIQCKGAAGDFDTGFRGGGGGSGGAIRLVAPIVDGFGTLDVVGGQGGRVSSFQTASSGRIRIDCRDRNAFRSLRLAGVGTRGTQMFVFPSYNPRLSIVEAAGRAIPAGNNEKVLFDLPSGPPTNVIIRVQAAGFTNNVPIQVVVSPEHGDSVSYNSTIDIQQGNPTTTNVSVTIPAGTISTIHVWSQM